MDLWIYVFIGTDNAKTIFVNAKISVHKALYPAHDASLLCAKTFDIKKKHFWH